MSVARMIHSLDQRRSINQYSASNQFLTYLPASNQFLTYLTCHQPLLRGRARLQGQTLYLSNVLQPQCILFAQYLENQSSSSLRKKNMASLGKCGLFASQPGNNTQLTRQKIINPPALYLKDQHFLMTELLAPFLKASASWRRQQVSQNIIYLARSPDPRGSFKTLSLALVSISCHQYLCKAFLSQLEVTFQIGKNGRDINTQRRHFLSSVPIMPITILMSSNGHILVLCQM